MTKKQTNGWREDLEKLKQENEEILVDYFNEKYGGNYDEDKVEDALDRWLSNLDEENAKEIIRQKGYGTVTVNLEDPEIGIVKNEFIEKFCSLYKTPIVVSGILEPDYLLLNTNNGDKIISFIEEKLEERTRKIIDIVHDKIEWGVSDIIDEIQRMYGLGLRD